MDEDELPALVRTQLDAILDRLPFDELSSSREAVRAETIRLLQPTEATSVDVLVALEDRQAAIDLDRQYRGGELVERLNILRWIAWAFSAAALLPLFVQFTRGTLVGSTTADVALATAVLGLVGLIATRSARRWILHRVRSDLGPIDYPALRIERARQRSEAALSRLVQTALATTERARITAPAHDLVSITSGPGLSSRTRRESRIDTRALEQVLGHISRPGGATIGIAGERGAGKSELLRACCDPDHLAAPLDPTRIVALSVPAPSTVSGPDFLRLLAFRLCQRTPGFRELSTLRSGPTGSRRLPLLVLAVALIAGLRLTGAIGDEPLREVTLFHVGWVLLAVLAVVAVTRVFGAAQRATRALMSRSAAPPPFWRGLLQVQVWTWQELLFGYAGTPAGRRTAAFAVDMATRLRFTTTTTQTGGGQMTLGAVQLTASQESGLESLPMSEPELVGEIAQLVGLLAADGYQVIVGIDELDKLEESSQAAQFLNSIKALFTIENCSFIVSVSDSAWRSFIGRGIPLRDVFDSSLDDVITVEPLDLFDAHRLLVRRGEQLTTPQVALSCWLAGGLPREVLRYARRLGEINNRLGPEQRLDVVADALLTDELRYQCLRIEREMPASEAGRDQVLDLCHRLHQLRADQIGAELEALVAGSPRPLEGTDGARLRRELLTYAYFLHAVRASLFGARFRALNGRPIREVASAAEPLSAARRAIQIDLARAWRSIGDTLEVMGEHRLREPGTP